MTRPTTRTNKNSALLRTLFWLAMTAGLFVTIEAGMSYRSAIQRQQKEQQFFLRWSSPQQADKPVELDALIALQQQGQELGLPVFELDYQILHHRWFAILQRFEELAGAATNSYLANGLSRESKDLQQLLLTLRADCDQQLRRNREIVDGGHWVFYNLRGAVSVMLAYSLLEFSRDAERSRTFLGEAVDDFKAAIQTVDSSSAPPAQRLVPRWNLELIIGAGESLRVGQSAGEENLEALRSQLQTVLPNTGGYAAGVPLENRVQK